tara:strand:+ start:193 stop:507 length:315 start_codon:yes stop_codon:yes gene_type:complete
MGCNNASGNDVNDSKPAMMNKQSMGGMMNTGNGDAGYMNRKTNPNWPTITYFPLYGRGSALHFQFEYAGHSYNDEFMQYTEWGSRKKAMGGGLPVVTLPDGMQL